MSLAAHLRAVLLEFEPLTKLIDDRFAPTINDIEAPLPFVLYMETDTDPICDFGGETSDVFTTIEMHVVSEDSDQAKQIAVLIWHVLKDYLGDKHGCKISDIQRVTDVDGGWDEEDESFRRILAVRILHRDAVPVIPE